MTVIPNEKPQRFSHFPTLTSVYLCDISTTMADHDEELAPTATPGYKAGEKKTLEEYQKLDEGDESLKKWKESLGIGKVAGPADDPRKVPLINNGRLSLSIWRWRSQAATM